MEANIELFKSIGLSDSKAKETSRNKAIAARLTSVIFEVIEVYENDQ